MLPSVKSLINHLLIHVPNWLQERSSWRGDEPGRDDGLVTGIHVNVDYLAATATPCAAFVMSAATACGCDT
jgi:hypothetical protein